MLVAAVVRIELLLCVLAVAVILLWLLLRRK